MLSSYFQTLRYSRPHVNSIIKSKQCTSLAVTVYIDICYSLSNMQLPLGFPCLLSLLFFPIQVTELSMGELLMHSTVSWLNPFLSLGKARKDLELTVFG